MCGAMPVSVFLPGMPAFSINYPMGSPLCKSAGNEFLPVVVARLWRAPDARERLEHSTLVQAEEKTDFQAERGVTHVHQA